MCDDPSVARYIPVPSPYTLTDGEEWVGDAARKWSEDHWAQFAVTGPRRASWSPAAA